jgi:hypothetical protein
VLISQATDDLAADMLETRKSIRWCQQIEPQGIFELLGRKGEVARVIGAA